MIDSLGMTDDPASLLAALRAGPAGVGANLSFRLPQYWLAGSPDINLHAICVTEGTDLLCIITDRTGVLPPAGEYPEHVDRATLERVAHDIDARVINLNQPLRLEPVQIEKPWGREIWYTGIERRGVSRIGKTPLPWLMGLAGELIYGAASAHLILLKILDPLPEPVYGDLYFEMHEQKIEVYVVTQVDESAWPGGTGAIRFGFDTEKLNDFDSLETFKTAWLDSVTRYRQIRVKIDEAFDRFREAEHIAPDDVVSPAIVEEWKRRIDRRLNDREQQYRERMLAFTALQPLRRGDVVRVPPFTPHSLQHGVRVVEFQTPHYERYILSFAQKVLTQSHWDTTAAIDKLDWHAHFNAQLTTLELTQGYSVDQIADFDEFEVHGIHLLPGGCYRRTLATYAIVMAVESCVLVCEVTLAPEQACLVPAMLPAVEIKPAADTGCFALIAIPKTTA